MGLTIALQNYILPANRMQHFHTYYALHTSEAWFWLAKAVPIAVPPAKTQVWSEYLLCTLCVAKNPRVLHADSEDPSCWQWRFWSDWTNAQTYLSHCWMHRSFCLFYRALDHVLYHIECSCYASACSCYQYASACSCYQYASACSLSICFSMLLLSICFSMLFVCFSMLIINMLQHARYQYASACSLYASACSCYQYASACSLYASACS